MGLTHIYTSPYGYGPYSFPFVNFSDPVLVEKANIAFRMKELKLLTTVKNKSRGKCRSRTEKREHSDVVTKASRTNRHRYPIVQLC